MMAAMAKSNINNDMCFVHLRKRHLKDKGTLCLNCKRMKKKKSQNLSLTLVTLTCGSCSPHSTCCVQFLD